MKVSRKLGLAAWSAGALALPLVAAAPASAQQATQQAQARPADARGAALEEIVVTARRREENLQLVPLTVTALTGDRLVESGVNAWDQLPLTVPSLSHSHLFRNSPFPSSTQIRGIGRVITYVADAPSGAVNGYGRDYDLESLQVIPGPQGTLFGLNALGGAIMVQPKKPNLDRIEGYVMGGVGNYGLKEGQAVLNVPIIPQKLALRIGVVTYNRDGFTKMLASFPGQAIRYTTQNPIPEKMLDDENTWGWRAQVTFKPAETVESYFLYHGLNSHTNGNSILVTKLNPTGLVAQLYPQMIGYLALQQSLGKRTQLPMNIDPTRVTASHEIINNTTWEVTDDITLKLIGRRTLPGLNTYQISDADGTPAEVASNLWSSNSTNTRVGYTKETSAEFQVNGTLIDEKLKYTAGAFYQMTEPSDDQKVAPCVNCVFSFGSANGTRTGFNQSRTQALFGQVTLDLGALSPGLDGINLTAGYRYNWDYSSANSAIRNAAGACNLAGSDANCTLEKNGKWTAPGFTFAIDYQLTPQTLIYATSRRAYSRGGFNSGTFTNTLNFGPEQVTDLEIGVKSDWTWGDVRGRTNVAAFTDWYKDIQKTVIALTPVAGGGSALISQTANIAKQRSTGFEVSFTFIPVESLEITGGYAFLTAYYTNWPDFVGTTPVNKKGLSVAGNPRHKGSLGVKYYVPVEERLGEVTIGGNLGAKGQQYADFDGSDIYKPQYQVNLRADWRNIAGWPVDVGLFVNNVTNATNPILTLQTWASVGLVSEGYNEPRMYGVQLKYRFGS